MYGQQIKFLKHVCKSKSQYQWCGVHTNIALSDKLIKYGLNKQQAVD